MLRQQQQAWDSIKPEDLGGKILENQRQIAELQTVRPLPSASPTQQTH